jgi:hypothetical protein
LNYVASDLVGVIQFYTGGLASANKRMIIGNSGDISILTTLDITGLTTCTGGIKTLGGITSKVTDVTNTYSILSTDETIRCSKTSAFNVTLPPAALTNIGQIYNIKNINTGAVTVIADTTGTPDLIDGETTQTVNQWENLKIQCTAVDTWSIL